MSMFPTTADKLKGLTMAVETLSDEVRSLTTKLSSVQARLDIATKAYEHAVNICEREGIYLDPNGETIDKIKGRK